MARTANHILLVSIMLGLAGAALFRDSLFHAVPWGLNIPVWVATLCLAVAFLSGRSGLADRRLALLALVPAVLSSVGLVFRDAGMLHLIDITLIGLCLLLSSASFKGLRLRAASIAIYLLGTVLAFFDLIARPFEVVREVDWSFVRPDRLRQLAPPVLKGLLIALPLMVVFGGLFVAADAAFEKLVAQALDLDIEPVWTTAVVTAFTAWLVSGLLHGMLRPTAVETESLTQPGYRAPLSLSIVESGMVLGLLDLLFLSFVCVQFQYCFGGLSVVASTSNLTLAEYARRGFFELSTVSALVLPLLLMLDWTFVPGCRRDQIIFRSLSAVQILLLFVIMASAVQRMYLYQQEFGLTELRLYTTAFMGWLALVYCVYMGTVLRGTRAGFAFGSTVTLLAVTAGLHAVNPDALIMQVNIARARDGKAFDLAYASTLSNDAVPTLLANIDALREPERTIVARTLLQSRSGASRVDFRGWHWSRVSAFDSISASQPKLKEIVALARPAAQPAAPSVDKSPELLVQPPHR